MGFRVDFPDWLSEYMAIAPETFRSGLQISMSFLPYVKEVNFNDGGIDLTFEMSLKDIKMVTKDGLQTTIENTVERFLQGSLSFDKRPLEGNMEDVSQIWESPVPVVARNRDDVVEYVMLKADKPSFDDYYEDKMSSTLSFRP